MTAPGRCMPAQSLLARARAANSTASKLIQASHRRARGHVNIELPATAEAPAVARGLIGELICRAAGTPAERDAVSMVVSELVSNAVRHAYDGDGGTVEIDAALIGGGVSMVVADSGRGPRLASPNPGGGFGWKIVAALADDFTILRRSTGGTFIIVRMCFSRRPLRRAHASDPTPPPLAPPPRSS